MYTLLNDFEGAFKSYNWFEKNYSDSSYEPFHHLCWTLTLFKLELLLEAKEKLAQLLTANEYLIPHLLGLTVERKEHWHSSNWEHPEYATEGPPQLIEIWDKESLNWVQQTYFEDLEFVKFKKAYEQLRTQLGSLEAGSKERSACIDEMSRLERHPFVAPGSNVVFLSEKKPY